MNAHSSDSVATTVVAYIGLGSNIEPRAQSLVQAVKYLETTSGISNLFSSSVYETEPIDMTDQSGAFLNQVVRIETTLTPEELIDSLQQIELQMGRAFKGARRARTIDLDLLLFGDLILQSSELTVPHPRIAERLFVLEPLLEIAPRIADPKTGTLLSEYRDQIVARSKSVRQSELTR